MSIISIIFWKNGKLTYQHITDITNVKNAVHLNIVKSSSFSKLFLYPKTLDYSFIDHEMWRTIKIIEKNRIISSHFFKPRSCPKKMCWISLIHCSTKEFNSEKLSNLTNFISDWSVLKITAPLYKSTRFSIIVILLHSITISSLGFTVTYHLSEHLS